MAAVNSHNLHQFIGKLTLYSHGIVTEQESVLNGRCCLYLCNQRNNDLTQLCKESVQRGHIQTFFVLIQQSIVGCFLGIVITCKLAIVVNDFLQNRRKGCKIILILRLFPDILGFVHQHGIGNIFLCRHFAHLVIALPQNFHLTALLRCQGIGICFQIFDHGNILRSGFQIVSDLGHDFHGLAAAFPAVGRGNSRRVVEHNAEGMIVCGHGALILFQRFQRLRNSFKFHRVSPILSTHNSITGRSIRQDGSIFLFSPAKKQSKTEIILAFF